MVSRGYLLEQPGPPSALKRLFDQQVLPAVIDIAGGCEAVLEAVLQRTRRQPLGVVGLACGAGFLFGLFGRRLVGGLRT